MNEVEWNLLVSELTKTAGALRVAALLKCGYGNTVAGVIAEFDRVAIDAKKAQDFVNYMFTNWWAVTGPRGEYWPIEMREWETVEEHILRRYPNTDIGSFLESAAHKAGLAGKDPRGKMFDRRQAP